MLTGFNTNIRHRGVLFHVQSEDSGRDHPHVITHLFHGGNIMASEKTDYEEHLDAEDLEARVRQLMEAQHKAVLKRLRAGDFDAVIRERLGEDVFAAETEPPASAQPEAAPRTEPAAETVTRDRTEPAAPTTPHLDHGPSDAIARGEGEASQAPEAGRAFGQGIVSDKPLDEVILNYLVENARKRKRQRAQ